MDASETCGSGINGGARVLVTGGALTVTVTRDNGPHAESELESESAVEIYRMGYHRWGAYVTRPATNPVAINALKYMIALKRVA